MGLAPKGPNSIARPEGPGQSAARNVGLKGRNRLRQMAILRGAGLIRSAVRAFASCLKVGLQHGLRAHSRFCRSTARHIRWAGRVSGPM